VVLSPQTQTPKENLLVSERGDRLRTALNRLPAAQKEALELAYYIRTNPYPNCRNYWQVSRYDQNSNSTGTVKTQIYFGARAIKIY